MVFILAAQQHPDGSSHRYGSTCWWTRLWDVYVLDLATQRPVDAFTAFLEHAQAGVSVGDVLSTLQDRGWQVADVRDDDQVLIEPRYNCPQCGAVALAGHASPDELDCRNTADCGWMGTPADVVHVATFA